MAVRPRTPTMRLCGIVCSVLLLAGGVVADINVEEGGHFVLSLITASSDTESVAAKCHVVTPQNEIIQLLPTDESPDRFTVGIPNFTVGCSVTVSEAVESDSGQWELHAETADGAVKWDGNTQVAVEKDTSGLIPLPHVTWLDQIDYVAKPGMTISVTLSQEGINESCFVKTPVGQSSELDALDIDGVAARTSSNFISCGALIGPIDESFLGTWGLCARKTDGTIRCQTANITIANNNWEPAIIAASTYGAVVGTNVFPELQGSGVPTTCNVITPNGDDLVITASSNYPGIQRDTSYTTSCRFNFGPMNENFIGTWSIYGRFDFLSVISEVQQTVLIYQQTGSDVVAAVPASVTISEGSDLYIRLASPTPFFESCKLLRPDDTEAPMYHIDEKYKESCGFIVPQVTSSDSGLWSIVIADGSIHKATSDVHVVRRWEGENNFFTWSKDRPVDQRLGPDDAVYCKIEDPQGSTVFEGFGRCRVVLEKVTSDHHGFWKMQVGSPGRVLTDEHQFLVNVADAAAKTVVVTEVSVEKPDVMISCSLSTDEVVRTCKFRDPSGKILLANQGVGEDGYVFHGAGVNVRSTGNSHECGLRITNPQTTDLGLWRCAVQTDKDEYYGFLTVLCPWAMMDPTVAASVISEPTLTAGSTAVTAVEGEGVTLSCSIQAPIKYCYFRARNGSIFNINEALTCEQRICNTAYIGTGLDAGECGIRFNSLHRSEGGAWSCHVGLVNGTEEQRVAINVQVDAPVVVEQRDENGWLVVEGHVPSNRQVEYCRFVRIDGVGFTSDNLPEGYVSSSDLANGVCRLHLPNPSILEHHPWTVVTRITSQVMEVAGTTSHTISVGGGETTSGGNGMPLKCLIFMVIVLTAAVVLAATLLIPKKNRDWTFRRANHLRESLRTSFRSSLFKKPLPTPIVVDHTPAVA